MDGDGSDKDSDSLVLSSNHREKREALLKWLEEKLASKGFNVSRDAVVKGSIVKHRFDILAEQEVIPGLRLRLGILVVGDREVDENIVERLIAWREELFIDKIAIVPMKGVKPEALEIASRYGIDLITPDWGIISAMGIEREVAEGIAKTYSYIEPVLDAGRVVELVKKELRHQLFRRPKVELSGLTLVYLPLVVADVKSSRVDEASGEVEILTGRVVVDGIRGFAIRSKNSSIGVDEDIGNIVEDLPETAIDVLKIISEEGATDIATLNSKLELSEEDIRAICEVLQSKGFIDYYGDYIEFRGIDLKSFANMERIVRRYGGKIVPGEPETEGKQGVVRLWLSISMKKLVDLLLSLQFEIERITVLFYPLYAVFIDEIEDGERREKLLLIDALSGAEAEGIYRVFTEVDILDRIKKCCVKVDYSQRG